jgi:hypothetical protein
MFIYFAYPLKHLPKLIFDFDPTSNGWKHPRGKPHMRWADITQNQFLVWGINTSEAPTLAQNRPLWRRLAALTFGSLYAGNAAKQEL